MATGQFQKPQNMKKAVLRLLRYMLPYRGQLILACICTFLTATCSVRATYLLKPAINDYILPYIGQKDPDLRAFTGILMTMAFYYLVSAGAVFVQTHLMTNICHQTICQIRDDMFSRMQKLPIRYFDTHARGGIISCYNSDVDAMTNMMKQSIPQVVNGAITIVSIFVTMLVLSRELTIVVVVYVLLMILVVKKIMKKNAIYYRGQQKAMSEVNGFIEELIEGQEEIKIFTREKKIRAQFQQLSETLFQSSAGAQTYAGSLFPISSGLSNVGFAVVAVTGAILVIQGRSDVGTVGAFLQYYRSFYTPLVQVSRQISNLTSALAGAERIFALLDEPGESDDGTAMLDAGRDLRQGIELQEVVFGYEKDRQILKGISLKVQPGQHVAFVGASGAGKTTIANLINRFYDVQGGKILVEGVDIREISRKHLRRQVAIVLQDAHFFTATIRENIRFGRLDASDEEVEEAARMVRADFFIEHLPMKYDTMIEADGAMLSEGQRQLLSIARAAVSQAPILIMDEATSSIDTRTEQLIEAGVRSLMEHKTVFIIAHRLSTVRSADQIVVLGEGRILESGSHGELMQRKGRYYDLNCGLAELL